MADNVRREDREKDEREGKDRMKKEKLSGSENRNAKKKRLLIESAEGSKSMRSFQAEDYFKVNFLFRC